MLEVEATVAQAARELTIIADPRDGTLESATTSAIRSASRHLKDARPEEVLSWALSYFGERIAIATGFGAEGAALIDMAAKIQADPNIFFLDTGFLFPETYDLRRRIEDRYGVSIRAFRPRLTAEKQAQQYGPELWSRLPDLCCGLRKIEPLREALEGLDAWATAIRSDQTPARASAQEVEWDERYNLVKVNPLVRWTKRQVWQYILKNDVPYNPLHDQGYLSIGCTHCTRAVRQGEDDRSGRWSGHAKTECGLHGGELHPPVSL
jgi:phosphoadenosine phosphosulfate reductase